MESGGLLSLPVELLHHLAKFLRVKDILACSATCHHLRHVFNNNSVWKKYLPEQLTSSLQTQVRWLEPSFDPQEALTPLCENRILYMDKTSLVNNWKNMNFVRHATKTDYNYSCGISNISKVVGEAVYKDRYLFLGRFINELESDGIEVWDISGEPVKVMALELDDLYYENIYIVGDYLVIVKCVKIEVYEIKISEKSLPLWFSFLITGNDAVYHAPISHPCVHDYGCVGWCYSVVDHYLFANKYETEPKLCTFHIWDIANACKVGSFKSPVMGFYITYHSNVGSKWFLHMNEWSAIDSYFFEFDVKRKSFSENVFKVSKTAIVHSIIYDPCIIIFEGVEYKSEGWGRDSVCKVYNFATSEKLIERRFPNSLGQISSTKVVNGRFILLCGPRFHVIDALTLETVDQFPFNHLCFTCYQLDIHGSIIILATNSRNCFEVWDVNKKERVPKDIDEVYTSHLYLNTTCTKLVSVTQQKIVVYHFF